MSARVTIVTAAAITALSGAAAVTLALVGPAAATGNRPTLHNATASSVALGATGTRHFTFTATVTDDSGIKNVKVLTWPGNARLVPRAADMAYADDATCKPVSKTSSTCTYTLPVSAHDSALVPGTWYVAVQATAKDHGTTFSPKAAHFTVRPATH